MLFKCKTCNGHGKLVEHKCLACDGTGVNKYGSNPNYPRSHPKRRSCSSCDGTGGSTVKCPDCMGIGRRLTP